MKENTVIKFARLRDDLPVFNEITDYSDTVDDNVRELYHAERSKLLRSWHNNAAPDDGVRVDKFSYDNGDYTGSGLIIIPESYEANKPFVFFVHGGGWNSLCKECYCYECAAIARETGSAVVCVDYRLAPEYKFPTYIEDCCAGLEKAMQLADTYRFDGSRVILCGDSAGGNIVAALNYVAHERKMHNICGQILLYPVTGRYFMQMEAGFVPEFLNSPEEKSSPLVSPVLGDLKLMPRTLIIVGTCDFLIEDNLAFANALLKADVDVQLLLYSGMPHGFIQMVNEEASDALESMCMFINSSL